MQGKYQESTDVEVIAPEQQEMLLVVRQNELLPDTAKSLQGSFAPLFAQARKVINQSKDITVTDAGQKLEIKLARECRLALKNIRIESDKLRKGLKDESLRFGRAIDGFHNILLHVAQTEENRLEDQEKFAERQEAERLAKLKAGRETILAGMGADPTPYQLGTMTEETFQALVSGIRLVREEAARQEAARIAREIAEAKERERIRLENESLKAEAAAKEKALKAERERVAAKEAAERERVAAKEAAERTRVAKEQAAAAAKAKAEYEELQRKAAAERKASEEQAAKIAAKVKAERDAIEVSARKERIKAQAESEAARKAAAAPDREKLLAFAAAIRALPIPALSFPHGDIFVQVEKFALWVEKKAETV